MNIPKEIRILGKKYDIIMFDDSDPIITGQVGLSSFEQARIYLHKNLKPDHMLDTFLHEVIHRIDGDMTLKLEEDGVTRFASGLACFILENGISFKFPVDKQKTTKNFK